MISWAFNTPQFWGLIISTILTILLIFFLYFFVIRKQIKGEAPSKAMMPLELYFNAMNGMFNSLTEGKNKWSYPYLFTLFNFIFINSFVCWIGFEVPPSTIMFTLPLALITFIGIYVVGIGTMGFIHFCKHKYSNPLEIIGQFLPLLSMSIRLFAATLAGAIIGNVTWIIIGGIMPSNDSELTLWFPAIQGLYKWVWGIVDTLESLLQAFVFTALTAVFWAMETGPSWSRKKRKELHKAEHAKHSAVTTISVTEEQSHKEEN